MLIMLSALGPVYVPSANVIVCPVCKSQDMDAPFFLSRLPLIHNSVAAQH